MWARLSLSLAAAAVLPVVLHAQEAEECGLLALFMEVETIQASCCNAATCNTPMALPGAIDPCTADCKSVFLPFWGRCADFVAANGMDADGGLAAFQLTCLAPPPPPPGETCTSLTGEQASERQFDPCVCAGDTNGDYAVTATDVLNVLRAYGMTDCRLRTDFSGECEVNVYDLLHVLDRFGNDCTVMTSCKSFVDMHHVYEGVVGDGLYQLGSPEDPGETVYCDMTALGGGWTLWQNFGSGDRWGLGEGIFDQTGLRRDGWSMSDDCDTTNDMGSYDAMSVTQAGTMVDDYMVVYSQSGACALTKTLPMDGDFSEVMVKAGSAVGEAYIAINEYRQPIAGPGIRMYPARPGDNFTIGEADDAVPAIYWVFYR